MNRAQCDMMIKRRQRTGMVNGEREQVGIGDLVVPHYTCPIQPRRIAQTDITPPKLVVKIVAGKRKFLPYLIEARRRALRVSRQIQDAQNTILGQRASRN
jgi:hypothetical protein